MLAACGSKDVEPSSIEELPDGSFTLYVECAHAVSARVVESAEGVRIDRVRGDIVDGDCLGAVPLSLATPIADRHVVVNGQRWVRIDADCELEVFAPENVAEERAWVVPRPCPSMP